MLSPTEQYKAQSVTVTTGHEPDLNRVAVPNYTDEEHETWAIMYKRQRDALPGRASDEFLEALDKLQLSADRIPRLKDVSEVLKKHTGWGITRVEGLVPKEEFFECLAQRLFPCTDFIRGRSELEYTPAPDIFHDMFGHIPLITNPEFAQFYEYFGKTALRAKPEQLAKLERIYWFTVEFGLIHNPQGIRIYGSGILSSVGEVHHALSPNVRHHPFDYQIVENQTYVIHEMQQDLFVIDSFEFLLDSFKKYTMKEGLARL